MPKRIAILQSNYIPWKGYFDLINMVDEFVLYDTAQYTRHDWRNRNRIKTVNGVRWLTIPVATGNTLSFPINEARVSDDRWIKKHWLTIQQSYARAPHFETYGPRFKEIYDDVLTEPYLSNINERFIRAVCNVLGIHTQISHATDYELTGDRVERLVSLCRQAGADVYLSGPAAQDYLDTTLFAAQGIKVEWMDYSDYPVYDQVHPPFEHSVSILDLIFCTGDDASNYMKSFKP